MNKAISNGKSQMANFKWFQICNLAFEIDVRDFSILDFRLLNFRLSTLDS